MTIYRGGQKPPGIGACVDIDPLREQSSNRGGAPLKGKRAFSVITDTGTVWLDRRMLGNEIQLVPEIGYAVTVMALGRLRYNQSLGAVRNAGGVNSQKAPATWLTQQHQQNSKVWLLAELFCSGATTGQAETHQVEALRSLPNLLYLLGLKEMTDSTEILKGSVGTFRTMKAA